MLTINDINTIVLLFLRGESEHNILTYIKGKRAENSQKLSSRRRRADEALPPEMQNQVLACFAQKGYVAILKYLIDECSFDPNNVDRENKTALDQAIVAHQRMAAEFLITRTTRFEKGTDASGCSTLHHATACGFLTIVEEILKKNRHLLSIRDNYGWTPLNTAIYYGQHDVVHFLLAQEGIDIHSATDALRTPFLIAMMKNDRILVEKIIEKISSPFSSIRVPFLVFQISSWRYLVKEIKNQTENQLDRLESLFSKICKYPLLCTLLTSGAGLYLGEKDELRDLLYCLCGLNSTDDSIEFIVLGNKDSKIVLATSLQQFASLREDKSIIWQDRQLALCLSDSWVRELPFSGPMREMLGAQYVEQIPIAEKSVISSDEFRFTKDMVMKKSLEQLPVAGVLGRFDAASDRFSLFFTELIDVARFTTKSEASTFDTNKIWKQYFYKLEEVILLLNHPNLNPMKKTKQAKHQGMETVQNAYQDANMKLRQVLTQYTDRYFLVPFLKKFMLNAFDSLSNHLSDSIKTHKGILKEKFPSMLLTMLYAKVRVVNIMAQQYIREGKMSLAFSLVQEGLKYISIIDTKVVTDHSDLDYLRSSILCTFAKINLQFGNIEKAHENVNEMLGYLQRVNESIDFKCEVVNDLVNILLSKGEYSSAISLLDRTVKHLTKASTQLGSSKYTRNAQFDSEMEYLSDFQSKLKISVEKHLEFKFNCVRNALMTNINCLFEKNENEFTIRFSLDDSFELSSDVAVKEFLRVNKDVDYVKGQFIFTRRFFEKHQYVENTLSYILKLYVPKNKASLIEPVDLTQEITEISFEDADTPKKRRKEKRHGIPMQQFEQPEQQVKEAMPAEETYGFDIPERHRLIKVLSEYLGDAYYIALPQDGREFERFNKAFGDPGFVPPIATKGVSQHGAKFDGTSVVLKCGGIDRAVGHQAQVIKGENGRIRTLFLIDQVVTKDQQPRKVYWK